MSAKLPTLWVCLTPTAHDEIHAARAYFKPDDPPNPADVPYVPASALDAANEALRLARAENERLRAQVSNAVTKLEGAQCLFASIRQADALASWACESEPGEESFDEKVREMLRDLEKVTGFATRQRAERTAALTTPAPKESSDE